MRLTLETFGNITIERYRSIEDRSHVGDFRDVPFGNIAIECFRSIEHKLHAGDFRDIPFGYIAVECCPVEQLGHVRDHAGVPTLDRTVRVNGKGIIANPITKSILEGFIRKNGCGDNGGKKVRSGKRV
jgi:hypothetical protein